jgi:acetyl-CoA carboxylase biotin carboxyl carrier protein
MKIGGRGAAQGPPFPDTELIRTLAALLTETGLTEIEYTIGDRRVRVARALAGTAPPSGPGIPASPPGVVGAIEHPGAVKAPMVGTAYLAPQPGMPPFVRLGDVVTEGQPLLIIEAMKVMNQIRAHRPGRLAQIVVADAQPVEYGAVLMLIE